MNHTINGGMVAVEDGIRLVTTDQFAPTKKARVELSFSVEEGGDPVAALDDVAQIARAKVFGILQTYKPGAVMTATEVIARKAEPTVADMKEANAALPAGDPAAVAEPAKRTRAKKETPAADPAAIGGDLTALAAVTKPAADPAAITAEPVKAAPAADGGPDYSDAGLFKAVTAINQKFGGTVAPKITPIVIEFCPQDGVAPSLKRIPADKRAAFIARLEAESVLWG
jgi:hypothetical protein